MLVTYISIRLTSRIGFYYYDVSYCTEVCILIDIWLLPSYVLFVTRYTRDNRLLSIRRESALEQHLDVG